MRMESKNSYFKQAAQVGGNYKNIPYSVAKHHQKLMCGYLQRNTFFSFEELECGPSKHSKNSIDHTQISYSI